MIKIVNKELVNKVNEVKALSLALRLCNKLLQCVIILQHVRKQVITPAKYLVLTTKSTLSRLKTHALRKNVLFPVIYLIFLLCLRMSGVVSQRWKWWFLPPDLSVTITQMLTGLHNRSMIT